MEANSSLPARTADDGIDRWHGTEIPGTARGVKVGWVLLLGRGLSKMRTRCRAISPGSWLRKRGD